MGKKCCAKAAEGHGCGCGTKRADTATVEEPDWIPDGDGRAIGQQDFAINLSPLHAEHEQGYDDRDDEAIGEKHRGRHSQDMKARRDESKGQTDHDHPHHPYADVSTMSADVVGSPTPTFDEGITGQDGPSAEPTNAVFEGTRGVSYAGRYGPQAADMTRAREQLKRYGYIKDDGDIVQDIFLYNDTPSKTTGRKADKYHYFALIEKDGRHYAINIYGPSKSLRDVVNILGPTGDKSYSMTSTGDGRHARSEWLKKQNAKIKKGYRPILFGKKGNIMEWDGSGFSAETLAEIEGPTAEATSGGLHSPSSFDMTWEDGMGQSSASIPPNEIAWAETSGIPTWVKAGAGIALLLAGSSFIKAKMSEQKAADNLRSVVNKRKGCCGGAKRFNARNMSDPAQSQDRQSCVANGCEWVEADPMTRSTSYCKCHHATAKEGGIQNQLDGGVTFQSEFSVGQINPVEVEGQNDIYGAEEFSSPKVSQPNWGPQTTYRQNPKRNLKMW